MIFKIKDFIVITDKKIEQLNEQYLKPSEIKNDKASGLRWEYKLREFNAFIDFYYIKNKIISDIFEFIEFIELLKAFSSKKLEHNTEYKINRIVSARIVQKDRIYSLQITFHNQKIYLSYFECSSLAAKLSKVLQRCEAWQELEV
jgi:hypothetical protein